LPRLCPGPRWGSLQRFPRPVAGFKEAAGRGGQGREGRRQEEGKRRRWKGRKGKERGLPPCKSFCRRYIKPTSCITV